MVEPKDVERLDQHKPMSCPRCKRWFDRAIMKKIVHESGAILDVCERCGGMWLDKDEVKLLATEVKDED